MTRSVESRRSLFLASLQKKVLRGSRKDGPYFGTETEKTDTAAGWVMQKICFFEVLGRIPWSILYMMIQSYMALTVVTFDRGYEFFICYSIGSVP